MSELFGKNFIVFGFLAVLILINAPVLADEPQIILFHTKWQAKTRSAKKTCNSLAKEFNFGLREIDIDQLQAQQKPKNLKVKIPDITPYIYVLSSNGKIIYKGKYTYSSAKEIKSTLTKK